MANKLYRGTDLTLREVAEALEVSTDFVMKWSQSDDQEFDKDQRGWEKGRGRKWDDQVVDQLVAIRTQLEEDPQQDYWGPTAVQVEYRKRFPDSEVPPLRTIGQILKDQGMTRNQEHCSKRGALRYLHYPESTVYQEIGDRVLEADLIEKNWSGQTAPLHFLGFSAKREPVIRHYERVDSKTTDEFIRATKGFFSRFERPDVLKIDNDTITAGGGHSRIVSRVMVFLLERKVYPVFSVIRNPATQASIEGTNALFSRKFWNRHEFESFQEMEQRLEKFNKNTREYHQYEPPEQKGDREEFEPVVYLLRQVRQGGEDQRGWVNVMDEEVQMPREYIGFYVLAEWRLREEKLVVRFEKEGDGKEVETEVVKECEFPIREASKKRCEELLTD